MTSTKRLALSPSYTPVASSYPRGSLKSGVHQKHSLTFNDAEIARVTCEWKHHQITHQLRIGKSNPAVTNGMRWSSDEPPPPGHRQHRSNTLSTADRALAIANAVADEVKPVIDYISMVPSSIIINIILPFTTSRVYTLGPGPHGGTVPFPTPDIHAMCLVNRAFSIMSSYYRDSCPGNITTISLLPPFVNHANEVFEEEQKEPSVMAKWQRIGSSGIGMRTGHRLRILVNPDINYWSSDDGLDKSEGFILMKRLMVNQRLTANLTGITVDMCTRFVQDRPMHLRYFSAGGDSTLPQLYLDYPALVDLSIEYHNSSRSYAMIYNTSLASALGPVLEDPDLKGRLVTMNGELPVDNEPGRCRNPECMDELEPKRFTVKCVAATACTCHTNHCLVCICYQAANCTNWST
jgi:hypothetical protein